MGSARIRDDTSKGLVHQLGKRAHNEPEASSLDGLFEVGHLLHVFFGKGTLFCTDHMKCSAQLEHLESPEGLVRRRIAHRLLRKSLAHLQRALLETSSRS